MSLVAPQLDYLVDSFHVGYMDSPAPERVPKGGTPDAKNCFLTDLQLQPTPGASLSKRNGGRMLTTAALVAASSFNGLFEFRKVGNVTGVLVGVCGGKVFYWDNISAFVQVGVTAPFTPGAKVQAYVSRNLLFLMDGATTRCWDGTLGNDLFTPGEVAPTAAGALTDGGAAGTTIPNATYEGVYTFYDSTHDHETSPSPATAQVAITAGHKRTWAQPTGVPGANYDKWRAYCRSVTANELYYKRVVDVAIATVSADDSFSDSARNLLALAPLPLSNDPPPLTFVTQVDFQGYRVGFKANDDQGYVSRLGDPQSQHPSDILGIYRGSGGEVRSAKTHGTECVIQKPTKSYRLKGDRMPFTPEELHGNYGNVGGNSAVSVKGKFFAWDQEKGPYFTDLNLTWQPIGTDRIRTTIDSIPKTFLSDIDCILASDKNLVMWAVAANVVGRRRTLLAWHTELNCWLPPITGLEYAALTTFVDQDGLTNLYVGDYWGRLYQYLVDDVEGVPSGSTIARVLSATAGTVTCDFDQTIGATGVPVTTTDAVAFFTSGDGLAGLPVLHIDAAGNRQWRRIQSNTGGTLTLDTTNDSEWSVTPVAGDTIVVGGIDFYWRSPVVTFGDPFRKKKGGYIAVRAKPASTSFGLKIAGFLEGFTTQTWMKVFSAFAVGSAWGTAIWGQFLWGGSDPTGLKARVMRSFFAFAFEVSNPYPNQPVSIIAVRLTADPQRRKWVGSSGGTA